MNAKRHNVHYTVVNSVEATNTHGAACRDFERADEVWQALVDYVAFDPFRGYALPGRTLEFVAKSPVPLDPRVPIVTFHYAVDFDREEVVIIKARYSADEPWPEQ